MHDSARYRSPSYSAQIFARFISKATEVYDHANFLSSTGPELTTELPRYTRVDMTPNPALVPRSRRLHRFPGREAGFSFQRAQRDVGGDLRSTNNMTV